MMKKLYFLIVLIFVVMVNAFSIPQPMQQYRLINVSNENVIVYFKTNENLKNVRTDDFLIDNYVFFNDGETVGRIDLHTNYELYNEILNQTVPSRNSFINGVFSFKYINLIVISRVRFFEYERDQTGNIINETFNGVTYPKMRNIRFPQLTGKEIFDLLVEEFIIYDMFGNIIMTLDDITENSFTTGFVEDYIEIYTEDFYNTGRYRFIGNNQNLGFSPYGLFITQEIIDEGRLKYIEIRE
jgi:hypothetical protein